MAKSTCNIDECEKDALTRGLCSMHYQRWRRSGGSANGRRTDSERFWAKVRKTETCWEWLGARASRGHSYGVFRVGAKVKRAHRFSWELVNGPVPEGLYLDHTCHHPWCVNPAHLRPATSKQNAENRKGPDATNLASGVRGVYRSKDRWIAQLKHNGDSVYLGRYATIAEAESVVIEARRKLFTHSQN